MVFLLEDGSIQAGSQDLQGWLIKLFGKDFWIQISIILDKSRPFPKLPGNNYLGHFQQNQVSFFRMLTIVLEDMEILGGLAVFIQERTIEGVVRKAQEGLMVLWNGSPHPWFGADHSPSRLLVVVESSIPFKKKLAANVRALPCRYVAWRYPPVSAEKIQLQQPIAP